MITGNVPIRILQDIKKPADLMHVFLGKPHGVNAMDQ